MTKATRYQLMAQMKGHTNSVQSLSMTCRRELLASGGEHFGHRLLILVHLIITKVPMVFDYGT